MRLKVHFQKMRFKFNPNILSSQETFGYAAHAFTLTSWGDIVQ